MRDIKFRAWFTDGKNKTLPGQIHSMQEDRTLLEFLQDIEDCKEEHGYNVILEQYTGLNDKHGKPIYESDKVKVTCKTYNPAGCQPDPPHYRSWEEVVEYPFTKQEGYVYEIIGNTHEQQTTNHKSLRSKE